MAPSSRTTHNQAWEAYEQHVCFSMVSSGKQTAECLTKHTCDKMTGLATNNLSSCKKEGLQKLERGRASGTVFVWYAYSAVSTLSQTTRVEPARILRPTLQAVEHGPRQACHVRPP
jgi:hypothetical protein